MTAGVGGEVAAKDGDAAAQHAPGSVIGHADVIKRQAAVDAGYILGLRLAFPHAHGAGVDHQGTAADRSAACRNAGAGSHDVHIQGVAIVDKRDSLIQDQSAAEAGIGLDKHHVAIDRRGKRGGQALIGNLTAAPLDGSPDGRRRRCGAPGRAALSRVHGRVSRGGRHIVVGRLLEHHVRGDPADHCAFIHVRRIGRRRHETNAHGDKQQHGDQLRKCFHVVFSFSVHICKIGIRKAVPYKDTVILYHVALKFARATCIIFTINFTDLLPFCFHVVIRSAAFYVYFSFLYQKNTKTRITGVVFCFLSVWCHYSR